jgi:hypothetical protein
MVMNTGSWDTPGIATLKNNSFTVDIDGDIPY